MLSDGAQPVGRGIGPALEARDVLQVLRNDPDAPADLADRACLIAGALLELTGKAPSGTGKAMALNALRTERVRRIVLVRPAVEAGEKLGFLPGDMQAKVNPYLRPLIDACPLPVRPAVLRRAAALA